MTQPAICTIVSNNYLAFARVLTKSFREHHPQGRVWVLVVDRPHETIDYGAEDFDVLFADELGIPAFANFAFRYSILELNTAVKPYLIEALHRRYGVEELCYFDPDILVTAPLDPLFDRLRRSDVLLTPHITRPIDDESTPGERDFLLSGIYNLGFLGIAINERTLPFLAWWQERLARYCVHRVSIGLFVDQRWMDFAPAFLERVEILRQACFNMAYWNLPHRRLERTDDGYSVDGEPLRFFHFSGFLYDEPNLVSKYQNRYELVDRPDLTAIFAEYRDRLEAAGHESFRGIPYAFGRFGNGAPVPDVAREAMKVVDWRGQRWEDPFDTAREDSFYDWLQESVPLGRRGRIPRLALVLWDHRADLQNAFPQPVTRDAAGFTQWFLEEVARDASVDDRFAEGVQRPLAAARGPAASRAGELGEPRGDLLTSLLSRTAERRPAMSRRDVRWLTEEAAMQEGVRPRVPRLAMLMRRDRHDLCTVFPDPLGGERAQFALWYATSARLEYGLPWALVLPVLRSLPLRAAAYGVAWGLRRRLRPRAEKAPQAEPAPPAVVAAAPQRSLRATRSGVAGLNVVGWPDARTGVGEICRGTLEALRDAGIPCAVWPLRHPVREANEVKQEAAPPTLPFATTLFHVNADMMDWVLHRLPLSARSGQFRIGYWFWELSYFPRELATAFRQVDEVWAPSRFCQQAFASLSPVPVRWVPPALRPIALGTATRADFGLPQDAFLFLFLFDALSIPERKNPKGLLEAFRHAVRGTDVPLHLVLKVGNARGQRRVVEEIERQAAGLPVTLIDRSLSRDQIFALISQADAYVSLHRSEGLGLPLIESMFLGKPVIAPAYGGCSDFLDESTGWPVPFDLVQLKRPHGPYPAGAVWAEPDPVAAGARMLAVTEQADEVATRCGAALRRVEGLYSPQVAARRLREEMSRLVARAVPSREGASVASTAPAPVAE